MAVPTGHQPSQLSSVSCQSLFKKVYFCVLFNSNLIAINPPHQNGYTHYRNTLQ